jgi:hypothetical protein
MDHPYCYEASSFDGVCEEGVAPQRMIVEKIYDATATWLCSIMGVDFNVMIS